MAFSAITADVIHTDALLEAVAAPAHGASLLFLGTVRDHNDGRPVRGMRYEAYVEMAKRVLAEIVAEAEAARLCSVAAVHRTGELQIGEVSVAIAAASAHRADAFEACRYVIEELKQRLPVWKHEHYTDGESEWVEGTDPTGGEADG
jgi:molybdopterin synthase catalytic subunit